MGLGQFFGARHARHSLNHFRKPARPTIDRAPQTRLATTGLDLRDAFMLGILDHLP